MNSGDSIDDQIAAAIASGELAPIRGVGEPLGKLDDDPMWWAKSLLGREKASDQRPDVIAERDRALARAIGAESLEEARAILASANKEVSSWNASVDDEFAVEPRDEIWLLTERENARH